MLSDMFLTKPNNLIQDHILLLLIFQFNNIWIVERSIPLNSFKICHTWPILKTLDVSAIKFFLHDFSFLLV